MSFNSREEYINAQSSEKIILAHVDCRARALPWTLYSGTTYEKDVDLYVIKVHNGLVEFTEGANQLSLSANQYFFSPTNKKLYINTGGDPVNEEIIVTYRLFFSNAGLPLSHDLTDTGVKTEYEGRIQRAPGFKHKIGVEQDLISIIGNGSLKLLNTDGGLDEIYERYIFDNQTISMYSWHRDLPISSSKIFYRGRITDKRYDTQFVWFEVKDELVDLKASYPLSIFGDSENVNASVKNNYKRQVYGRVDGLKLQSVDQIGSGYSIPGLFTGVAGNQIINTSAIDLYTYISPDDKVIIGTQEFTVDNIVSAGSFSITNEIKFSFTNLSATLVPDIPVTTKNRTFFVADHECAEIVTTISEIKQLNRIKVASTDGLFIGDFIEFETLERSEIKNITQDGTIVLQQNLITLPTVGSNVYRRPIQEVFIGTERVLDADYSIVNSGDCRVVIANDAEFNLAQPRFFNFNLSFTNGSRNVTSSGVEDLSEYLKPRDWVKPQNLSYSTYYEVLSVDETTLTLRIPFADATHNGLAQGKLPNYISDDTIVSTNILGKTETGLKGGLWISTAPQAIKDMLLLAGLTEINTQSFIDGIERKTEIIGVAIPYSPGTTQTTFKTLIDDLARSTQSVITLDNDLKIKYKILEAEVPENPVEITDFDVISWSLDTVSGKNIRNAIVYYKEQDVNRFTQEDGSEVVTFTSEFVEKYVGTNNTEERDVKLYNQEAAEAFANRLVYYQSIGRTDMQITTDLRFEDVEIGDVVVVNFNRMFNRLGSSTSKRKMMFVFGKSLNGSRTVLELTDYGNLYNRSSKITENTHPEFSLSTDEERLNGGYITENNGIVENDANTAGIHLIS